MIRRLGALAVIVSLLGACSGGGEDPVAALIPSLQAAETLVPQALVCPSVAANDREYRPLLVGTLDQLELEVPAAVRDSSTRVWVSGGVKIKVGMWSDANARPSAMMFVADLGDGTFALSKVRYCDL